MKMLVVSDSHMYNDILEHITNKWKNKVDLLVHCGDSSLLPDDPLLKDYDIVVHGNHDEEVFPHYVVYKDIFVTHGNDYHVYTGYDELIQACKENHCTICFHGHTHVPTIQIHEGITFVNPGSAMINRGSYGYGTYAIVETEPFNVIYYDSLDHHICNQEVLEEGMALLDEFKKIVKNMNKGDSELSPFKYYFSSNLFLLYSMMNMTSFRSSSGNSDNNLAIFAIL